MQSLDTRLPDLLLHIVLQSLDSEKSVRARADEWLKRITDIRFFGVMPGILDMLEVLDAFNKATQPAGTSFEQVTMEVALFENRMLDLLLRRGSFEQGLKESRILADASDCSTGSSRGRRRQH